MSMNGLLLLALVLTAFCTLAMVSVVVRIMFNESLSLLKRRRRSRLKEGSKAVQGSGANPS